MNSTNFTHLVISCIVLVGILSSAQLTSANEQISLTSLGSIEIDPLLSNGFMTMSTTLFKRDNGEFVLIGGSANSENPHGKDVYFLQANSHGFEVARTVQLPIALIKPTVLELGHSVYVLGGMEVGSLGGTQGKVFRYDDAKNVFVLDSENDQLLFDVTYFLSQGKIMRFIPEYIGSTSFAYMAMTDVYHPGLGWGEARILSGTLHLSNSFADTPVAVFPWHDKLFLLQKTKLTIIDLGSDRVEPVQLDVTLQPHNGCGQINDVYVKDETLYLLCTAWSHTSDGLFDLDSYHISDKGLSYANTASVATKVQEPWYLVNDGFGISMSLDGSESDKILYLQIGDTVPTLKDLARKDSPLVVQLYREIQQREPDPAGLAYWTNRYRQGLPISKIREAFLASPEYKEKHRK